MISKLAMGAGISVRGPIKRDRRLFYVIDLDYPNGSPRRVELRGDAAVRFLELQHLGQLQGRPR